MVFFFFFDIQLCLTIRCRCILCNTRVTSSSQRYYTCVHFSLPKYKVRSVKIRLKNKLTICLCFLSQEFIPRLLNYLPLIGPRDQITESLMFLVHGVNFFYSDHARKNLIVIWQRIISIRIPRNCHLISLITRHKSSLISLSSSARSMGLCVVCKATNVRTFP